MKQYLDLFSSISQLTVGWSIALGSVLILIYCMDINFYPKGIEIGDGLFFIWTALAFGGRLIFTIFVFSAIGLSLYTILVSFMNLIPKVSLPKTKNSIVGPVHYFTAAILILFALAKAKVWLEYGTIPSFDVIYWLILVFVLLMNGFIATALLEYKGQAGSTSDDTEEINDSTSLFNSESKKQRRIFYAVFSLMLFGIPFFFIKGFGDRVLNLSIADLGIKKENVSLYLNEESSSYVTNLVGKGNYDIVLVPIGNGRHRIDNAHVLFQGIGEISHILLNSDSGDLLFDLPASSFIVSKESEVKPIGKLAKLVHKELSKVFKRHEINFNPDTYVISFTEKYSEFSVGSSNISSSFESVINESIPPILDFLNSHQELIKGIEVIGYSSNEWKKSDSKVDAYIKNHDLAISRSSKFVKHLYETENIRSRMSHMINMISIKGVSSNTRISKNKRTVEIRIIPRRNKKS